MKPIQNLHTHSTYCDGAHTPDEMIAFAQAKGFRSLGFSGHSYMHFAQCGSASLEGTERYKAEIRELQQKYADECDVFLGLEVDMLSEIDLSGYDYLIGSVHYLKMGDAYADFDRPVDRVQAVINEFFGGDGMAFAKEYYRHVAQLPTYGNFDIIGHFDIITKNCEVANLFDCGSKEYYDAAMEAMEALKGRIPFFELNTGAMARGYRTSPYPAVPLLKEFKRLGFGVVITSDCHNGEYLDYYFDGARELLLNCGFKERYILTTSGFTAVEL